MARGGRPGVGGAAGNGGDTGETITMWTRAATQTQSERLVKAYNDSHDNQVELTVIPTDNYQARIAAAAGGKNLSGGALPRNFRTVGAMLALTAATSS